MDSVFHRVDVRCLTQSCPRVDFLWPNPTREKLNPTRPNPGHTEDFRTRPDPTRKFPTQPDPTRETRQFSQPDPTRPATNCDVTAIFVLFAFAIII